MKSQKVARNVSLVLLLLKICLVLGQKSVILIDPGHGGTDTGAIGINGAYEKDINLEFALEIAAINQSTKNKPYNIYLTRYRDTLISLVDRATLAKRLDADLVLSIHCNHAENPDAAGAEAYAFSLNSEENNAAVYMAYELQGALNKNLGLKSRGVKFARFQLLRELYSYCPVVLLELGFLSNPTESNYLTNTESIRAMALVIVKTLQKNGNTQL